MYWYMVMHFGENFDVSLKYANTAFRGFGGWFVLIILNLFMFAGVALLCIGASFVVLGLLSQMGLISSADIGSVAGTHLDAVVLSTWAGGILFVFGLVLTLIFGIFIAGVQIRAYRGGELNFAHFGRLICDGFFALVILCVYLLPYCIITTLAAFGPVDNGVYYVLVCVVVPVLVLIVSLLIGFTALVHFAKEEKFGAAFRVKEICGIISDIGWLRYLGYLCLAGLIVGVVELVLTMIPVVGLVLMPVVLGFVQIFQARFVGNLYETAGE